ncbi:MAG TPA: MFS transporter [Blastocatellia bacterium]|nr:MFS transporter [Blastocatellia bacterium]
MRSERLLPEQKSQSRQTIIHIGFVLTGVVTTLLGPILPVLSHQWQINDSESGYLFTAQFMGGLCGMLMSNGVAARIGLTRALISGFGLMGVGTGALAISGWPAAILSVFCFGLGIGITIPLSNVAVSDLNPERRAAALNILNFCWSIGAVIGPPLVALQMRHSQEYWGLMVLSILLIAMILFLSLRPLATSNFESETVESHYSSASIFSRAFITIGALAFIYVGTETSVGGWAASYAMRDENSGSIFWVGSQSIFWASLMVGRGIAPVVLRYISNKRLVFVGILMAVVGIGLLLISKGAGLLGLGLVLIGFGFGPVYPTTTAVLLQQFGSKATKLIGSFFALSSLGGAIVPWVVGFISNKSGSLRTGLSALLIDGIAMLVLVLLQES